mmetsp:Transcript_19997/g.33706  ORF Transcript_19997/g.33706 Transcript_19997/m.33706 type:complete len:577 (+) Transcript_19997:385-2115(+)
MGHNQRVQMLTNHVLLCLGVSRSQREGQVRRVHRHGLGSGSSSLGLALRSISHLVGVLNVLLLASSLLLALGAASIGLTSGLVLALHATTVLVDGAGDLVVGTSTTLLLVHRHAHVVVRHGVSARCHVHWSSGHHVVHHREWLTGGHGSTRVHVHWVAHGSSLHGISGAIVVGGTISTSTGAVGGRKMLLAKLLALVHGNKQRLSTNHLAIHLSDGSGGLLSRRVANKGKALANSRRLTHDAGGSHGTERSKQLQKGLVSDRLIQVLDVQVHSLELGDLLTLGSIQLSLQLALTLNLLLGTVDVHSEWLDLGVSILVALEGLVIQLINGLLGRLMISKINKTKSHGVTILVKLDLEAGDGSERRKHLSEALLGPVLGEVLGIQIGPLVGGCTVLATQESADIDLLVLEHVAIDLLDGLLGSLGSLVMNISISLGHSCLISGYFARQNVTKDGEEVKEALVVHRIGKVLHEHVTNTGFTDGGVTLGPHDAARAALDVSKVHRVESTLSILDVVEVHIGVSERSTSDGVTADSDGGHGSNSVEHLKQESLSDFGMKISHVKGGGLERGRLGRNHFCGF